MRKKGHSIRDVEKSLGIPRSTLSGWFKNIKLSEEQKSQLHKKWLDGLNKARIKAIVWHNQQKAIRVKIAETEALNILSQIDMTNDATLELALAMLYLGEGSKGGQTSLGNSNLLILKFFIECLVRLYKLDVKSMRFELHLRADQNSAEIKKYWSKGLNVPLGNFTSVSFDQRTVGSLTYPTYKGVCVVQCANVALQRRMVYLSHRFCEEITNQRRFRFRRDRNRPNELRAVSSVGRAHS